MFFDIMDKIFSRKKINLQTVAYLKGYYYPTKEMVVFVHDFLIENFRGSSDEVHGGILSEGNIEHNLHEIKYYVRCDGTFKENCILKAAHLMNSFITSHAFVDGNKRIGFVLFLLFLMLNEVKFSLNFSNYLIHSEFIKDLAERKKDDKENVALIIKWYSENNKRSASP